MRIRRKRIRRKNRPDFKVSISDGASIIGRLKIGGFSLCC